MGWWLVGAERGSGGRGEASGPVYAAHLAELLVLGVADSADGQVALAYAAAMDDRAGVVNLAATGKALTELMRSIRDSAVPREASELDRLRAARESRTGVAKAAGRKPSAC